MQGSFIDLCLLDLSFAIDDVDNELAANKEIEKRDKKARIESIMKFFEMARAR